MRHLQLLGRSGRMAESAADASLMLLLPGSAAFVASVTMAMCDAASAAEAAALCTESSARPLLGLMHAGGVLADDVLTSQTLGSLRTAAAPKQLASARLGGVFSRQPSVFQLFFSSVAALLGSPGQANYSAANAALDAAAQRAHQRPQLPEPRPLKLLLQSSPPRTKLTCGLPARLLPTGTTRDGLSYRHRAS
jgi:hypothetical protein